MHLRALRLFPLLSTVELSPATSSSFFTLASREWSRRIHGHDERRNTRGKKRAIKSGSSIPTTDLSSRTSLSCNTPKDAKKRRDGNPTARLASEKKATILSDKQKQGQSCVRIPERTNCEDADISWMVPDNAYFDPVLNDHEHIYFDPVLNNYEPTRIDLFSIEAPFKDYLKRLSSKDLSSYLTTVNTEGFPLRSLPVLPTPTSARGLYHNLIHTLRTRTSRPSLAALVDYHLLFPDHHSAKSYNLLIFLSIHHRAYGITQKLFRAMQGCSIQPNIETHRLYVRCLIFQGFWDKAWSYAIQLTKKFPGGSIPFPIWSEFCHTRSKGPIMEGTFNSRTRKQLYRDVSEPFSLIFARSNVMNTNRPVSIPALKDTPPASIRNIVQLMIKTGLKHQALKLTEDYFRALPLKLDSRMNHRCLDIVKIHLTFNGKGKSGLPRFNVAKTLFYSLLSTNPSLRPTSDTLIFILSILKKVKHSGTVAWKFISLCKEKWGPEVEDRRIQRRISRLALKEGRMDIVETLLRAEAIEQRSRRRDLIELEVVGDSARPHNKLLHRPPVRRIYPRNGRETYLWHRLRLRVRRTIKKRKAQGRMFTSREQLLARQRALTRKPTKSIP